jgi:hypothetical protein
VPPRTEGKKLVFIARELDSRLFVVKGKPIEPDQGQPGWMRLTRRGATMKTRGAIDVCYGPSGIAWPARSGLASRPSCELLGFGLACQGADG